MTQDLLPPTPAPTPPDHSDLAFTPVPRRTKRWNGITPQKQQQFIAHLAACGAVRMAADAIGTSSSAMYQLRRAEGAESFAAAWDRAVEMGARRVLDTLMDHAIHGTPETLLQGGEVVAERRRYNTRSMMWIVQQRFPEQYGGSLNVGGRPASSMPHGMKALKEQWRAEWEAEREEEARLEAEEEAEAKAEFLRRMELLRNPARRLGGGEDQADLGYQDAG